MRKMNFLTRKRSRRSNAPFPYHVPPKIGTLTRTCVGSALSFNSKMKGEKRVWPKLIVHFRINWDIQRREWGNLDYCLYKGRLTLTNKMSVTSFRVRTKIFGKFWCTCNQRPLKIWQTAYKQRMWWYSGMNPCNNFVHNSVLSADFSLSN